MAGKANPSIIAERYALALLELAGETGHEDQVASDLSGMHHAISNHADLKRFITSPLLGQKSANLLVADLLKAMDACALTVSFMDILVKNNRLGLMHEITKSFSAMLANQRGEIHVTVTHANAIDNKRQKEITQALERAVNQKLETSFQQDENLLGGIIIKIGSKMLDASAKSRLEKMRFAMKGA